MLASHTAFPIMLRSSDGRGGRAHLQSVHDLQSKVTRLQQLSMEHSDGEDEPPPQQAGHVEGEEWGPEGGKEGERRPRAASNPKRAPGRAPPPPPAKAKAEAQAAKAAAAAADAHLAAARPDREKVSALPCYMYALHCSLLRCPPYRRLLTSLLVVFPRERR